MAFSRIFAPPIIIIVPYIAKMNVFVLIRDTTPPRHVYVNPLYNICIVIKNKFVEKQNSVFRLPFQGGGRGQICFKRNTNDDVLV